jgi:hypothetical protein
LEYTAKFENSSFKKEWVVILRNGGGTYIF